MLQQNALILLAGFIFLFFFTPDYRETQVISPALIGVILLVFTLAPGLLLYLFGRKTIKQLTNDRDRQIIQRERSNRYATGLGMLALAGFVFEIYYLRFPSLVNRIFAFWKFENSRTLICIVPLAIAVLLNRLAVFELDRQIRDALSSRRKFLTLNLKLMLFPLLPFIISVFIADIVDHSPIAVRVFLIANSYVYWIIMLAIVATVYIKAPFFIRHIWTTRPLLEGEVRNRIKSLANREGIKYRDVFIWNTEGGKMANAGVVGLLPGERYIFLTESVLDNFTLDEIETIVSHELGHIKYKHAFAYLVVSLGYLVFYTLLYIHFLPIIEKWHLSVTLTAFLSSIVTLVGFCVYFVFVFRYLSRRFERQADLYALDVTRNPSALKSALIKLASENRIPYRVPRLLEVIRTHPSVYRRLEFIDRAVNKDEKVLKARKPIFNVAMSSILVLFALSLLIATNKESLFPPGEVHYEIGRQYAIEGMVDEAIREFNESVRADPESEDAYYALGVLYARKGVMEEAIKQLEKVLEINPKNVAAQERLNQIQNLKEDEERKD